MRIKKIRHKFCFLKRFQIEMTHLVFVFSCDSYYHSLLQPPRRHFDKFQILSRTVNKPRNAEFFCPNPPWIRMPILVDYPSRVKTIPFTMVHTYLSFAKKACVPRKYENDLLFFSRQQCPNLFHTLYNGTVQTHLRFSRKRNSFRQ